MQGNQNSGQQHWNHSIQNCVNEFNAICVVNVFDCG